MQDMDDSHVELEDVYAFSGNLRVFLDAQPWRMLVNLQGQRLSAFGVIGIFRSGSGQSLSAKDLEPMFWEGETYKLQIDDDQDLQAVENLGAVRKATLVEKRFHKSGLELAFKFLKN